MSKIALFAKSSNNGQFASKQKNTRMVANITMAQGGRETTEVFKTKQVKRSIFKTKLCHEGQKSQIMLAALINN